MHNATGKTIKYHTLESCRNSKMETNREQPTLFLVSLCHLRPVFQQEIESQIYNMSTVNERNKF